MRKEKLAGRTPMEAVLDDFVDKETPFDFKMDENGRVIHLFSATSTQIQMAKQMNTVILLDCTYKTNRFKMPLLNFVLVTDLNTSFICALCFLKEEKLSDYQWALECFGRFFTDAEKPKV